MQEPIRLIANRYQLLESIGQGGMGIVYHAMDRLRGEHVALKSISTLAGRLDDVSGSIATLPIEIVATETLSVPNLSIRGSFTARTAPNVFVGMPGNRKALRMALTQEFRALASLRHPNIITVLDYGFDSDKMPFFTMELLSEARPLLAAAGQLPAPERVALLIQVAQALLYLHRHGVLHRDLKSANILVISSPAGLQAKVLDFGLAVVKSQGEVSVGSVAGTMHYMAPEVLLGCPPTEAADLYSFGVTAFELLTERLPFDSTHPGKLLRSILELPPDLSALAGEEPLRELMAALLAKDPAQRPRDASVLCAQLARAAGLDAPIEARSIRESLLQAAAFVARDSEVETLQTALDEMMSKHGSGWLIGGESGVGKSRLLDEVRTQALILGAQVLRGQAVKLSGAPYQAIREILRALCLQVGVDEAQASCLLPLLPDLPALLQRFVVELPPLDAKATQERLLRTIEGAIARISQPTVILLEDIHWAGLEVILTLSRLMRRIVKLPIVLIASYRDDEAPWVPSALPAMELLKLHRFDRDSVAALSESMLGPVGRQPELVELLLRETEGNAFFMVEVLRSLAEERGMLSEVGRGKLPEKVFVGGMRAVVQRRLNQVPASAHKLLRLAAAAGRELDLAVLRRVEPDLEQWLDACASVAVIEVSESRWRFAHDKLRDCLLEKLSPQERCALHREVAELIEGTYREADRDPSALAYHYAQAGLMETAAGYAIQAGEIALREGAIEKSVVCFEDALRWLENRPANDVLLAVRALRLAGLARRWLGRIADSLAYFTRAWATFGIALPPGPSAFDRLSLETLDRQVDAALAATLAPAPGLTAVVPAATPLENELLELASSSLASLLWSGLGRWAYFVCAIGIKLAERRNLTAKLATFHYNMTYLLHLISSVRLTRVFWAKAQIEAADLGNQDKALARVQQRVQRQLMLSRCQWVAARGDGQDTGHDRTVDSASSLLDSLHIIAIDYHQAQYEAMTRHARSLIVRAANYGNSQYLAWGHTGHALGLWRGGNRGAAMTALRESMAHVNRSGDFLCQNVVWAVSALLILEQGDPAGALSWADKALEQQDQGMPTGQGMLEGYASLVEVYLLLWRSATDLTKKADLGLKLERASAAFGRYAQTYQLGRPRAALYAGMRAQSSAQPERALAEFALCIKRAVRTGMAFEEGRGHLALATALPSADASRQTHLQQAVALFSRIGAKSEEQQARQLLTERSAN